MSGFHDVRFPLSIGLAAQGGPERRTEIIALASGREERNTAWRDSRRRWDAAPGVRSQDELAQLVAFFEARRGRLHAFRFSDPLDHRSCAPSQTPSSTDQILGQGDGVTQAFALTKRYGDSAAHWSRPICHPVAGTVRAAVDGVETPVEIAEGGRIVFEVAPAPGAQITAGFRFDTPARFETDRLDIAAEGEGAGRLISVPVVEVKL